MPPFSEIIAAIHSHETFMIVGYVGPDGDAIGTGLALRLALEKHGQTRGHDLHRRRTHDLPLLAVSGNCRARIARRFQAAMRVRD